MIVQTRVTAQGTEYWDNNEKRVRFVPTGEKPGFEVTENPKSMIAGVDLSNDTDMAVITKSKPNGEIMASKVIINNIDLDAMNGNQLRSFAKQNGIEVPGNMKKEETIRNHIAEQLSADGE